MTTNPLDIDLANLDPGHSLVLHGPVPMATFGYSIAAVDINGDGFDDLAVGAPLLNGPSTFSGSTFVLFGSETGIAADANDLDGTNGFRLDGTNTYDLVGSVLASAGDVNGDGFGDLLIGSWGPVPDLMGSVYLVFGAAGGFAAASDIAAIDGSDGYRFVTGGAGNMLPTSLAAVGDVDGDGTSDFILSTTNAGSGEAFVILGRGIAALDAADGVTDGTITLGNLDGSDGFRLTGPGPSFGSWVSGAGDLNHDGYSDILVGAAAEEHPDYATGGAYVVFGQPSFAPDLDVTTLDGSNGFSLYGLHSSDFLGAAVVSAGDINGDGYDDIALGAPANSDNGLDSGATYVVFGKAGGYGPQVDLSTLDGSNGFELIGSAGSHVGQSLLGDVDINGDGLSDLVVGAPGAGSLYVVFGQRGGWSTAIDPTSLDAQHGFAIHGTEGGALAVADFNADGLVDLAIGTASVDTRTGSVTVIYGSEPLTAVHRTGGSHADTMGGGAFDDVLSGADGDDRVHGNAGDDRLYGGSGADDLFGGDGSDAIDGGSGNDRLDGAAGDDVLNGGSGNDVMLGGDGDDVLNGSGGNDTLDLGDGDNSANGGSGDDVITAGSGIDRLLGGSGNDALNGGEGTNTLNGGSGDDILQGGSGKDSLSGSDGNDILLGGGGNDTLSAGDGNDAVDGGLGNDTITASGGVTIVLAGAGNDAISLYDSLDATDSIDGGLGTDILKLNGDYSAGVTFAASTLINVETLSLAAGNSYAFISADGTVAAGATLTVSAGALHAGDTLDFDGSAETDGAFAITSGNGDDSLRGGALSDKLDAGAGNNILEGGGGADRLSAGKGADIFVYHAVTDSTGAARDAITGFDATDDVLDLDFTVTGIDARLNTGTLRSAHFDSDLATAIDAGHLAANHAIAFVASAGNLVGHIFLVVDANGLAGYQAGQDLVVELATAPHLGALSTDNFV
jgi:Ca2+-binding RTX toxin-like protein